MGIYVTIIVTFIVLTGMKCIILKLYFTLRLYFLPTFV